METIPAAWPGKGSGNQLIQKIFLADSTTTSSTSWAQALSTALSYIRVIRQIADRSVITFPQACIVICVCSDFEWWFDNGFRIQICSPWRYGIPTPHLTLPGPRNTNTRNIRLFLSLWNPNCCLPHPYSGHVFELAEKESKLKADLSDKWHTRLIFLIQPSTQNIQFMNTILSNCDKTPKQ